MNHNERLTLLNRVLRELERKLQRKYLRTTTAHQKMFIELYNAKHYLTGSPDYDVSKNIELALFWARNEDKTLLDWLTNQLEPLTTTNLNLDTTVE